VTRARSVKVVIADDHPMYREGVAKAINERPDLTVVGEAGDGREAVRVIDELRPDVAVLDIKMPEVEGIEALRALRARGNEVSVLFLSAFIDGPVVHEAFGAGALGVLHKENGRRAICDAISSVARGERVVDDRAQGQLLEGFAPPPTETALTSREMEVLRLTVAGKTPREIAEELTLSHETVRSHLYRGVYGKLGVGNRAEAIAEAMRRGLVE
jgi:two-component system, NarL family, nitrate/nitrite response regulator NarL